MFVRLWNIVYIICICSKLSLNLVSIMEFRFLLFLWFTKLTWKNLTITLSAFWKNRGTAIRLEKVLLFLLGIDYNKNKEWSNWMLLKWYTYRSLKKLSAISVKTHGGFVYVRNKFSKNSGAKTKNLWRPTWNW